MKNKPRKQIVQEGVVAFMQSNKSAFDYMNLLVLFASNTRNDQLGYEDIQEILIHVVDHGNY